MSAEATNEPTPTAHVVRRRRLGLAWITPLATLVVIGWLGYDVWRAQPVRARVQFAQARREARQGAGRPGPPFSGSGGPCR